MRRYPLRPPLGSIPLCIDRAWARWGAAWHLRSSGLALSRTLYRHAERSGSPLSPEPGATAQQTSTAVVALFIKLYHTSHELYVVGEGVAAESTH